MNAISGGQDFEDFVREIWDRHHQSVREYFGQCEDSAYSSSLLEFDIENTDPTVLCSFLGLPQESVSDFKHVNKTATSAER